MRRIQVALGLLAAVSLGYAAWRSTRAASDDECQVCRRPVHHNSRTTAMVAGRKAVFCCLGCAMSQHHQAGQAIQVTGLTDFATGSPLAPADAWVVRGSDVNPCVRQEAMIDADKQPAPVQYDRCAPGMLAFARREDAREFIARHGGQLLPFPQLAAAFAH